MVPKVDAIQETVTIRYIRFKVTTCLYLSPYNRARSLSTLMAVSVNKDTPPKIRSVILKITNAVRQKFHPSFRVDIR